MGNIPNNTPVKSILPINGNEQLKIKSIVKEIKHKGHWIGELDIINSSNELVPCAVKIFPLYDEKKRIENFINVFRDIREKKALENQLKHAQKMELLGAMTGSIVHDMNNILTGVGYNVELIKLIKNISPEKLEKYIGNIEKSVDNASGMLQKILQFTRKTKVSKGPVKLAEILDDVLSLVLPIFKKHTKISFTNNFKCKEHKIYGNKSSIVQVLLNLLINAIDAINDSNKKTEKYL